MTNRILSMVLVFVLVCCNGIIALTANAATIATVFTFTASEVDENGRFSLTFNSPVELFGVTLAIEYDNSKVVPINAEGSSIIINSSGTNFTIDKLPNDWVQSAQSAKAYSDYIIIKTSGSSTEPENYAYGDLYRIHFQTLPGTSIQTNPFQLKNSALYHGGIHAVYSSYLTYGIREGTAAVRWDIDALTVGNTTVPEVISAEASPNTLLVGNTTTFTVKTNTKATKLIMYTETGAIADEWSDSSYYTDNGNERIWTIEREIYSAGKRFLTFKASDGENVNDLSTATVTLQVTSEGKTMQTTLTSQKNVTITIGESYYATWKTDITTQSYNLLIYYNGNLIRTIKNYRYQSYTLTPAMLSNQGEYAIEVIPYYPGYDAIGDTATITVSPSEISTTVIKNIDSTSEVVCNVDNFECTVTTNANTNKVVLEYELGNRSELTLASSTTTEKTWKLSKKLNYIGKRKLTVRALDSNGIETAPSFVNVDVIPENINWNLSYDEASGELTVNTSDVISSKLAGAYAKLVVYKSGSNKNLLENSGELALINKGNAKGRTWNVFTDLNLTSGETYTFAISYLSTYAQKYNCAAIIKTIGTKTISDTEEELPEIYSIDMEIDDTSEVSLMSSTEVDSGEVSLTIGDSAKFIIATNQSVNEVFMIDANNSDNKNALIKLNATSKTLGIIKVWVVNHKFTSLHDKRPIKFVAQDTAGNYSGVLAYKNKLSVGFPGGAWDGVFLNWDDGDYLRITQDESIKEYNSNNKYYLWIRKAGTTDDYVCYHNREEIRVPLVRQNENGCISHTFDIENDLPMLEANTVYEYGISGKSTYCDGMDVATVDYTINNGDTPKTFTTSELNHNKKIIIKYIKNPKEGLFVYRSPYQSVVNRAKDRDGNDIWLKDVSSVECDYESSYAEFYDKTEFEKNVWVRIKCENYVNGVKYDTAYIKKEFLSDNPYMIWPTDNDISRISSNYGMRMHPTKNVYKKHTGIDIIGSNGVACNGRNIYAAASGNVVTCNYDPSYGNEVIIDHGNGYYTLYGHMSKIIAKKGFVNTGDIIGKIGSTGGSSTGPHLHFEVRKDKNKYGNDVDPLQYIRTDGQNNYYTPVPINSIELMSVEAQLTYEIVLYNKYGEIITTISAASDNTSFINIPYSTEYISFIAIPNNIDSSAVVSYNGTIIEGTETFAISKEVSNVIDVVYVDGETNEQTAYAVELTREDAKTENFLTFVAIADNERESGGDVPCYNVDISDNMTITLPKSISEIGLTLETDNPYASTRVFKNGHYWIDKDVILLDDTTNELTIIVENELGDEKEYTLTINKKSEYESDTTLETLNIFAYDGADEYIDVYTFDSTVNEIKGLSENAETIIINASATSDFAAVTYYINGEETIFDKPISLSSGFVLTVRVTAENGTYKDYTYVIPPAPLTKTTFENTATHHKFHVTFEEATKDATIYAAIYDENDKLLGVQSKLCDGDDDYNMEVPLNADTKKAKIFVWKNNIEPLGGTEVLNMK